MYFISKFWPGVLRAPSHTRLRAHDTVTLWALSLVETAEPVQVRYFTLVTSTLEGPTGTNGVSMWMQDGCKVYVDSYMASNGSCFMVTWTVFINHFLAVVVLIQIRETKARTLTTVDHFKILYFIYCIFPLTLQVTNFFGLSPVSFPWSPTLVDFIFLTPHFLLYTLYFFWLCKRFFSSWRAFSSYNHELWSSATLLTSLELKQNNKPKAKACNWSMPQWTLITLDTKESKILT